MVLSFPELAQNQKPRGMSFDMNHVKKQSLRLVVIE
jgi:hypothetical protein